MVKHSGVGECIAFRGKLLLMLNVGPLTVVSWLEAGLQTWYRLDDRRNMPQQRVDKTSQQMWWRKTREDGLTLQGPSVTLISAAFTVYSEECCFSFRLKQPWSEGYQYHRGVLFLPLVSTFAAARWWLLCRPVGQLGRISVSTHTHTTFALRYSLSFNNKLSRDQTERGPICAGR